MGLEVERADYLTRIKPKGERAMSRKPVGVALPVEVDKFVRNLPNRADWLRKAIVDAYMKEVKKSENSL